MSTLQAPKAVALWSLTISVLVTFASLLGLFDARTYEEETENWATQAQGQDIGNLLAVGTLILSGYLYSKGSFRAALVWIGTLFYLVYAYIVYSVAVHFNGLFLVYVAALGSSIWAALFAVSGARSHPASFPEGFPKKLAGFTLASVGALFAFLWLSELIPALISGRVPQSVVDAGLWVNPIHVIDLAVVLPAFVLSGYWTLKGQDRGLFFVGPWLVFSVLMGTSIVAAMVLMMARGFDNVVPPLTMVSVIVAVSLVAAWRYLRAVSAPR